MSVLKIALPGNDVRDNRPSNFVLDSRYSNPKINTLATPPHAGVIRVNWQSTKIITYDDTFIIYSFPHGYGYVPSVYGNYHFDNGSKRLEGLLPFQLGALGIILIDADDKNINLKYFSTDFTSAVPIPAFLINIRYYVMAERGYE